MMEEKTFEIVITGRNNSELQGTLQHPDGSVSDFLSVIELLHDIRSTLTEKD
jgi:hypothetical protein